MKKRKIVAYIRLSTVRKSSVFKTKDELISEHLEMVRFANPDMEIDEYYVDEFDCRTERNPQTELYRLMQDCKTGKIGLVLVPITRNMTNDSATTRKYVHELLELPRPVGVYFEYENVYSLAPNGMEELDKALAYWDYHRKIKSRRSCFHTNARFNQLAKGVTLDITSISEFQ